MLQPSQVHQNFNLCLITSPMSVPSSCVHSYVAHLICTQGRPLLHKAKPSYVFSILKPQGQNSRSPVRLLPHKVKQSDVSSILKPHGQSSKSHVRLLLREAKPSYVCTILKQHYLPRVGPKNLCASAHLGCTRAEGTS